MKLGANMPMGPLELGDFIGLDVCLSIMRVLYEGTANSNLVRALCSLNTSRRAGLAASPAAGFTIIRSNRLHRIIVYWSYLGIRAIRLWDANAATGIQIRQ